MLQLIAGSDRLQNSDLLIARICARAKQGVENQILIVPEQSSHEAERALCDCGGDTISRFAEVLSFTRLASRVASVCGGVCEEYLDGGGRLLTVYRAAQQVLHEIRYFAAALTKAEFLQRLGAAFEEFLSYALTPQMLLDASKRLTGQFAQKTQELGLLYESYLSVCAQTRNDPVTRLSELSERLLDEPYAETRIFYLDGFSDFTGAQKKIIAALLQRSREVHITLTTGADGEAAFETANETRRELKKLAQSLNVPVTLETAGMSEARGEENRFYLRSLFSGQDALWQNETDQIRFYHAASLEDECRFAAHEIRRLVNMGFRYREICVAVTDEARYIPALRALFARSGIAAYVSGSEDISRTPLISFVLACLRACDRLDTQEVLQYLKSGFAPATVRQADRLEQYAHLWNIRGSQWQQEWKLHPRGMGNDWKEEDKRTLSQLECDRQTALAPLLSLREDLKQAKTVTGQLQALAAFYTRIDLSSTLSKQTEQLYAQGEAQRAQQTEQLYDILIAAMEQAHRVLGELSMEQALFTQLFSLLLGCYQVGSIPAACDEVQLGSITDQRQKRARAMIVLGAQDELLPAFSPQLGVLTDEERQKLLSMGLSLAPAQQQRLQRELGWIYAALSAPTERVSFSFCGDTPSFLYTRTRRVFAQCRELCENDVPFFADAVQAAAAAVREGMEEGALAQALIPAVKELAARKSYDFTPLRPETVRGLYGEEIQLSASKIDQFAACRLAYFYRYGLKAEPWKQAKLDAPVFGTFVHYVLEHTVRDVMEQGGFGKLSQSQTQQIAQRHIDAFADAYLKDLQNRPAREAYLFSRNLDEVRAVVSDVTAELQQSAFAPAAEELQFGFAEDALPPIRVKTPVGDGVIGGFVDRLDTFESEFGRYYRVVDYKTGGKDFDYASVLEGEGLQMLIYLFALRDAPQLKNAQPAGVLYVPAKYPMQRLEPGMDETDAEAAREKLLRRKGLVLANERVLCAMDAELEHGKYLPVKVKKDGLSGDLASGEQMETLRTFIERKLASLTQAMLQGSVLPNPMIRGPQMSACQFCDYAAACHKDACRHENRYIASVPAQTFWNEVEKEANADG